ncbi:MAG: serine hydrolase domain-containing protein [Ignavibacteriaceae bacterium]
MKIKNQSKISILTLLILFVAFQILPGCSQQQQSVKNDSGSSSLSSFKDEKRFYTLDSIINKSIEDSAFPGAVILVQKDGKIIYNKAYGYYTYDTASGRVSVNTMYDLASVTKVIATTSAAMICYDRGLFKLDDRVSKFLPQFGVKGKEKVSIRNLLVHDSGLRPDIPSYKAFDSVKNKEQGVMNEIFNDTLIYPTGTEMVYSDLNFILLGKIIEKVTGTSLDKFCNENIFEPLDMNSTMFDPPKSLIGRIAPTENDNYWRHRQIRGTVHDETSQLLNGVAGHAGLFSTAGDIAKLLQMLLQKGIYKGKRYIKSSTVEMFVKKQSDLSSRALGWDTKSPEHSTAGNFFSSISYGHLGFTGTSVWTDPTRKLFVVLLSNRVYPTRNNEKIRKVRPEVHDAVINAIED